MEKRRRVKEFLRQKNVDMVLFQETKRIEISEQFLKTLWPEDLVDFMAVDAKGSAGGLLCVWKPEVFELIDSCSNRNYIIPSGKIHLVIECVVVNVYAPNDRIMRRKLWAIYNLSFLNLGASGEILMKLEQWLKGNDVKEEIGG
ncbi:hypothetical protein ACSBR1_017671 [Camellia fascicularis]